MAKKIFGQMGRLKKDKIEEYQELHMYAVHTPQWKGILDMIQHCNIRNYSIFIQDDIVFAYFEYFGNDYEADMARMAADPVTQEWWKHTRPCFTKYSENSEDAFYSDMQQIFEFSGYDD